MKKGRSVIALFGICLFIWVAYSACIKNNCVGVACANNGVCVDGVCACPTGYEGKYCDTGWSEKFSGEWIASDRYLNDTSGAVYTYKIIVEGSKDSFLVYGLADSLTIKCKRNSLYSFSISEQRPDSNVTITYGKATIDINKQVVSGLYTIKTDTTVTARFSWTR